jgi:hypothetical protein
MSTISDLAIDDRVTVPAINKFRSGFMGGWVFGSVDLCLARGIRGCEVDGGVLQMHMASMSRSHIRDAMQRFKLIYYLQKRSLAKMKRTGDAGAWSVPLAPMSRHC